VLLALASLLLDGPALAQESDSAHRQKLDEVVREAVDGGRSVNAIVQFNDDGARTRAAGTIERRGGSVRRSLNDIGALNVTIDADTANVLVRDAGVRGISVDAIVRSSDEPTRQVQGARRGSNQRNQSSDRTGREISIAIIDSGVQPHADLPAHRIRKFVDFVNGRTNPYDDFGHGTHVAGIAAASGVAPRAFNDQVLGAAPEVDIVALKVLDSTGAGTTSDVIAALEWIAANHARYNIRVVNMSLGHPVYEPAASDPLVQAAEALVHRGIVVVASAGNLGVDPRDQEVGFGGVTSPANGPSIIAVGAVDTKETKSRGDDSVTDYSSRGPTRFDLLVKPDLVAVGHRVVSLAAPDSFLARTHPELLDEGQYMTLSGTSMAAPAVAGTAAVMLGENPRLSAGTVRAVLEFTAQHLPNTNLLTQGAGYLNASGAVRLAGVLNPREDIGSVWLRTRGSVPETYDVIDGEQIAWAKNVIWGDSVLLGDSAYLHLAAWNDNIVWGQDDNIVWGQRDNIVWGQRDNIVWGQRDNIVWGQDDNIVWGQDDNIVWGQDNIVWGQVALENIVWGQCDTVLCDNVVRSQDNIVWGQDNIVWGQDNIVWGQDNIVWGQDNIVWGQSGMLLGYWADNTVWGFWSEAVDWTRVDLRTQDNIVWGQDYLDNIVWGQDNIVWGQDNIVWGQNLAILTKGAQ
jgi:serine protease AprX